ncbi:MAG: amino acid--tRNA ligase-related protein [Alkalispirochaeta sp.]
MTDLSRRIAPLRHRARLVAAIRAFLDGRGYLAVETPRLCRTPIPEAHIELFETHRAAHPDDSLWLLPSPEYYLKQLLAAGSGSIYEITHSFRDGEEIGRYHDIEFTMLEYYTVNADGDASLEVTRELLQALGETTAPVNLSMQEAWKRFIGIDLAATIQESGVSGERRATAKAGGRGLNSSASSAGAPETTGHRDLMVEAIRRAGLTLSISPDDAWEDLFQRVFLSYIEPELPRDRPVFVTDYPAAVSTLARRKSGTPWADRWELYLGGVEVANCFGEETDPDRIAVFFREQQTEKPLLGRRVHPVDPTFLRAPPLPRCSGVAMGVDRLVMHLLGANDMGEVVSFRP